MWGTGGGGCSFAALFLCLETARAQTCPPSTWGACTWPPTETDPCCSEHGYAGSTSAYCDAPGTDSRGSGSTSPTCCSRDTGAWTCQGVAASPTASPVANAPPTSGECTGVPAIDALLNAANLNSIAKLHLSTVYSWSGFCSAIREIGAATTFPFYIGGTVAHGAVNVAAFLAQTMWESGGDTPYSACDENNYLGTVTAPCTQRGDGQPYASLIGPPACAVDLAMTMTAETYASWTPGPMTCIPNTVTAGCCWWGRGAIQTTGPHNYRMLQLDVVSKISSLSSIDLCVNPEAICQGDAMKWLGGLYYWASIVQADVNYQPSLDAFVAADFDRSASVVSGADFAGGTGALVNNGAWSAFGPAHKNEKRVANFDALVQALRAAGMVSGGPSAPTGAPVVAPPTTAAPTTSGGGGGAAPSCTAIGQGSLCDDAVYACSGNCRGFAPGYGTPGCIADTACTAAVPSWAIGSVCSCAAPTPSVGPTAAPLSSAPSAVPTATPTAGPTASPTAPTNAPSNAPTALDETYTPTSSPTPPSAAPTLATAAPASGLTAAPLSSAPSAAPTPTPTDGVAARVGGAASDDGELDVLHTVGIVALVAAAILGIVVLLSGALLLVLIKQRRGAQNNIASFGTDAEDTKARLSDAFSGAVAGVELEELGQSWGPAPTSHGESEALPSYPDAHEENSTRNSLT